MRNIKLTRIAREQKLSLSAQKSISCWKSRNLTYFWRPRYIDNMCVFVYVYILSNVNVGNTQCLMSSWNRPPSGWGHCWIVPWSSYMGLMSHGHPANGNPSSWNVNPYQIYDGWPPQIWAIYGDLNQLNRFSTMARMLLLELDSSNNYSFPLRIQHDYGKSQCLRGKWSVKWPCSIALPKYRSIPGYTMDHYGTLWKFHAIVGVCGQP